MQKPWEGRFKERTEEFVERFTQSVSFDKELAPWDIRQSIAHVKTLLKAGLLKEEEAQRLIEGLEAIKKEILEGSFEFKEELEDVHMNIEAELINRLGDLGGKLHTSILFKRSSLAVPPKVFLLSATFSALKISSTSSS